MNKTAIEFLISIKDMLPMSNEKPCTIPSNSELRRWISQGVVLFNTERVEINEIIDFPIFSLVVFPNSTKKRCTLV